MNQPIEFNGDEIERKVPMIHQVKDEFQASVSRLQRIAERNWAEGATDDQTLAARAMYQKLMEEGVQPVYGALGEAIGVQGDKIEIVGKLGDVTEAGSAGLSQWGPGAHGH